MLSLRNLLEDRIGKKQRSHGLADALDLTNPRIGTSCDISDLVM
jgi:hypothetical protein